MSINTLLLKIDWIYIVLDLLLNGRDSNVIRINQSLLVDLISELAVNVIWIRIVLLLSNQGLKSRDPSILLFESSDLLYNTVHWLWSSFTEGCKTEPLSWFFWQYDSELDGAQSPLNNVFLLLELVSGYLQLFCLFQSICFSIKSWIGLPIFFSSHVIEDVFDILESSFVLWVDFLLLLFGTLLIRNICRTVPHGLRNYTVPVLEGHRCFRVIWSLIWLRLVGVDIHLPFWPIVQLLQS